MKDPNEIAREMIAKGFKTDYAERKAQPIATGVLDYFPLALLAIAEVSADGNAQHNPGEPLHWAREKSTDEANTAIRHFLQRGTFDGKVRHMAKACWRFLALLEKEIEADIQQSEERVATYLANRMHINRCTCADDAVTHRSDCPAVIAEHAPAPVCNCYGLCRADCSTFIAGREHR